MRQSIRMAVIGAVLAAVLPGSAFAAENLITFFERNKDVYVTQGEWAVYLVKAVGKESDVKTSASQLDFIALLEKNRIQPLDGWQHGQFLTYGQKAVTMVQALGLEDQLPPDAKEADYVWFLEGLGFHEGSPQQLVRQSDALARNINDPIFQEIAGNEFNINISLFSPRTKDTAPR